MDTQDIQDRQLIERYLQGQLTGEEERQFEERFLGDPNLLDELEYAEALRQGMRELADAAGLESPNRPPRLRARSRWLRLLQSPQYAVAASVALFASLVLSGLLYQDNVDLRVSAPGDGILPARVIPLNTDRGGVERSELSVPGPNEFTVFTISAGATPYDEYRATVVRVGNNEETVARSDVLPVNFDERVVVSVPGRLLTVGTYEIVLEGRFRDRPDDRPFEPVSSNRVVITE